VRLTRPQDDTLDAPTGRGMGNSWGRFSAARMPALCVHRDTMLWATLGVKTRGCFVLIVASRVYNKDEDALDFKSDYNLQLGAFSHLKNLPTRLHPVILQHRHAQCIP
jgi:hypothetical protein